MKATPITPWATARIVATARWLNSAPCSRPTTRAKMALPLRSLACPKAMMTPAMMRAAMNCRITPPMLATIASAALASSLDLRLQVLHQPRQIGMGLLPDGVDLLADDGHAATVGRGGGTLREGEADR